MRQRRYQIIFLLILIFFLQIALRIPFLNEPFERDEGLYGYMGQRILAGEIPYRDVFDHKPPAVYYIYAAVIKLFGNSLFSIRVFTLFYSLLTTLALFGVGNLIFGTTGGLLAAFLYALFSGGPLIQGASSNTETFMVLPLVLALLCFLIAQKRDNKSWYFLAGLFSGLAFMMKQVAALNFLALLIFAFSFQAVWLILGFAVFPAIFFFYFLLNGAVGDLIYCNFAVNQMYLKISPVPFFFFYPQKGLDAIFKLLIFENGILWLLSLAAILLIFIKVRKRDLLIIVVWSFFSFVGVAAGTFFFGHYFIQIIPALCLLAGFNLLNISEKGDYFSKITIGTFILFILFLNYQYQKNFYFKFNPHQISEMHYGTKTFGVAHLVSKELKDKLSLKDDIFVWAAEPEVYFYLNKKAPGRFSFYFYWMKDLGVLDQILKNLKEKKPRFVFWTSYTPSVPQLEKWIMRNYNLKGMFLDWKFYERMR